MRKQTHNDAKLKNTNVLFLLLQVYFTMVVYIYCLGLSQDDWWSYPN